MRAGVGLPSVWGGLRQQIFLGDEAFVARVQAEVSRMQQRPLAKPLTEYRLEHADDPHVGMALAYLSGDYIMKAIAAELGFITQPSAGSSNNMKQKIPVDVT